MKNCPKCSLEHSKAGKYCSRACANSRVWSEEEKKKKSEQLKKYISENPSWKQKQLDVVEARAEVLKETLYQKNLNKFNEGKILYRATLKKWLIETRSEVCEECGLGSQWNNKYISLQVDHINGKNNDNRPDNLRLLCPNCHSQTENFSGKSSRKKN